MLRVVRCCVPWFYVMQLFSSWIYVLCYVTVKHGGSCLAFFQCSREESETSDGRWRKGALPVDCTERADDSRTGRLLGTFHYLYSGRLVTIRSSSCSSNRNTSRTTVKPLRRLQWGGLGQVRPVVGNWTRTWEFQSSVLELFSDWGEAEDHVEIGADPGQEILVQVFVGRWTPGVLHFHDGNQFLCDLVYFVTGEQIRHLFK